MAQIISQHVHKIPNGNLVSTIVKLTAATDSFTLPQSSDVNGTAPVVQVTRPGDSAVTLSSSHAASGGRYYHAVIIVGTVGQEALIVSHHNDPLTEATYA